MASGVTKSTHKIKYTHEASHVLFICSVYTCTFLTKIIYIFIRVALPCIPSNELSTISLPHCCPLNLHWVVESLSKWHIIQ